MITLHGHILQIDCLQAHRLLNRGFLAILISFCLKMFIFVTQYNLKVAQVYRFLLVAMLQEFDLGAQYMASSIAGLPRTWTSHQTAGVIFHLTRTLYFGYHYASALMLLRDFSSRVFPDAWIADVNIRSGIDSAEQIDTLSAMVIHSQPRDVDSANSTSATPSSEHGLPDGTKHSPSENHDLQVDGYHCAILLHAFILAAVYKPELLVPMAQCIRRWLPARRDELWRQYNAEVRFAVVIDRLVPFPSELSPSNGRRLYLLGESHSLPLAWTSLSLGEQPITHQLVPRLAIGLKAWHFNPKLDYCRERQILLHHAASIPARSIIVVCAGEIDLREEGVIAMLPQHFGPSRPPKYASSDAAIEVTLAAFCAGLEQLRDSKHHRIVVHPVRPVPRSYTGKNGAVCASLIRKWNYKLKSMLDGLEDIDALDFYDELCCADARVDVNGSVTKSDTRQPCDHERLREEFDIQDGVHMNRSYLPLFRRSLHRLFRGPIRR